MTTYYDMYWHSADVAALMVGVGAEPNVIGPKAGDADVPGTDPLLWYVAVRATAFIPTPPGCSDTPQALATSLLGVWA